MRFKPKRIIRWVQLLVVNLIVLVSIDLLTASIYSKSEEKTPPKSLKHDLLGFRRAPNLKTDFPWPEHPSGQITKLTNSMGLASSKEYTLKKNRETFRIVVVGDSHTAGAMSPTETYPARLEQYLTELSPRNIEVVNGGHGRYSPYQSLLMLDNELLKLSPNLVVVAIYIGNDFADLLRFDDRPSFTLDDGGIEYHKPEYIVYANSPVPIWSNNSMVYRFYRQNLKFYKDRVVYLKSLVNSLGGSFKDAVDIVRIFGRVDDRGIISQSLAQTVIFDRFPLAKIKSIELMNAVVNMHHELAMNNNYDLLFLLIPSKLQIESNLDAERIKRAYALASIKHQSQQLDDEITDFLIRYLEENHHQYVDMRSALKAASTREQPMYWSKDYHINIHGSAVIAKSLSDHIFVESLLRATLPIN